MIWIVIVLSATGVALLLANAMLAVRVFQLSIRLDSLEGRHNESTGIVSRMDRLEAAVVSDVMEDDTIRVDTVRNERIMRTYRELVQTGMNRTAAMTEARQLWTRYGK